MIAVGAFHSFEASSIRVCQDALQGVFEAVMLESDIKMAVLVNPGIYQHQT